VNVQPGGVCISARQKGAMWSSEASRATSHTPVGILKKCFDNGLVIEEVAANHGRPCQFVNPTPGATGKVASVGTECGKSDSGSSFCRIVTAANDASEVTVTTPRIS
jgi:hypothetical protein